ncbi:MAG TPA: methyltransferase domain-containing protein [Stellaceae bacterium]|nr:methyltransferase domain-containing protein [Stellaceae bacterium]
MILRSNLPRLRTLAGAAERVLDVGGWYRPFNLATHVIDLLPYATRRGQEALDPEDAERFTAATWHVGDVCAVPWPFPDRFFDFVVCSNLLEDVRDPLGVCAEINRVGRAGYIETPSRLREIFVKARRSAWRGRLAGDAPEIGFYHHRWFVEAEGAHLRFTAKTAALAERRGHYLTRGDLGRKLGEAESGLGLFWEGGFTCEEVFADPRDDYPRFRNEALARLVRR